MLRLHTHWALALGLAFGLATGVWAAPPKTARKPAGFKLGRPPIPAEATPIDEENPVPESAAGSGQVDNGPAGVELIQERYTNGNIKVQRYVTEDQDGNYVNHGPWVVYNEEGRKVGGGEYRLGRQHGVWHRIHQAEEGSIFQSQLYRQFQPPFLSEVQLSEGQLHGVWTIYDARRLKISEWEFNEGKRDGKSVWYFPNGQKAREVDYRGNEVHGQVVVWNDQGQIVQDDRYDHGRKLAHQVLWHGPGRKRAEGWMLMAKTGSEANYDWWNGNILVTIPPAGMVNEKHGQWTWWYANGQRFCQGEYAEDQPNGRWTFWHENGLKHMEGRYVAGQQEGTWRSWNEEGVLHIAEAQQDEDWAQAHVEAQEDAFAVPRPRDREEEAERFEMGKLRAKNFE